MEFVINSPVALEESLTCEFKEASGNAAQNVGKIVDNYVVAFLNAAGGSIYWGIRDDRIVTGVRASDKTRDELRQVIGQKLASIAPPVPVECIAAPFHNVRNQDGAEVPDICVLEVAVSRPNSPSLYFTGSGEAYRRTIGGIKKLTGAELYAALAVPFGAKVKADGPSVISRIPSVYRRGALAEPLLRGRRVLWVDDSPSNNFYERTALGELGISAHVAVSTSEALEAVQYLPPDVIVSDIARGTEQDAGVRMLDTMRSKGIDIPVIFYGAQLAKGRGTPPSAFGITNRPDEVLHLVLDVLERMAG